VSGYQRIAEDYLNVELPPGESITTAACPVGKTLVGGGGGITKTYGLSFLTARPAMIYNGPDQNGGEQWNIIWHSGKENNVYADILVYAICADVSQ
jgi:hypothetical protein